MTRDDILTRISISPNVCFGKPCIRGHRIWVSLILDFLASGESVPDILGNYPGLEEADILACIAYGARCLASVTSRYKGKPSSSNSTRIRASAGQVLGDCS